MAISKAPMTVVSIFHLNSEFMFPFELNQLISVDSKSAVSASNKIGSISVDSKSALQYNQYSIPLYVQY